ncbi:MAG: HD domain-containing protein [Deltaproteobacteria bacterium]|nr:HD domain-containing protein [Deltaproteobacteria bacterium]MBW2156287.1 HD domain-containing protein [Deltaproteobacteria bacterium]
MTDRTTCKELEQRVKALEKKIAENQLIIDKLRRHNKNEKYDREPQGYHNSIQLARMATILALAKLAEYRDDDTGIHLERIREYTKIIAEEMAKKPNYIGYITKEYIDDIYHSSILHDIGKVGIPDAILLKPGKLIPEEFELMKTHSTLGGDVLTVIDAGIEGQTFLTLAKEIAYYHHERWNGTGYPKGLSGENIPLSARIVALPDVYDALTSKRVYKNIISHEKAKEIIINEKGKHFDPDVVDSFLAREDDFKMICEKLHHEDYYTGHGKRKKASNRFGCPEQN